MDRHPKIKPEDCPSYFLATLYGVPKPGDENLSEKNRIAWNRYFSANLDENTRAKLIDDKRHPAEELRPLSPEELHEVEKAFAERCKESGERTGEFPRAPPLWIFRMSSWDQFLFITASSDIPALTARSSLAVPCFLV